MSSRSVAVLLCVAMTLSGGHFLGAQERENTGRDTIGGIRLKDFSLKDSRGKEYTLSNFQHSKFIVGIFLGTECPLVKLYGQRLAVLSELYEPRGVSFVGFNRREEPDLFLGSQWGTRRGSG